MSLNRCITSKKFSGSGPLGCHKWAAKINALRRGLSSKMASVGEVERDRPSFQERPALHAGPEFLPSGETMLDGVAANDGSIDGTDRGADDPVRFDAGLMQRFIDAALVSPERAAALHDEHDLALRRIAECIDGVEGRSIRSDVHPHLLKWHRPS